MESISEIIKRTRQTTMAVATTRMTMQEYVAESESVFDFVSNTKFEAFDDKDLENMFKACVKFIYQAEQWSNAETKGRGLWLSLVGKSGVGKTMLATDVYNTIDKHFRQYAKLTGQKCFFDFGFWSIADVANAMREGAGDVHAGLSALDLLLIDDIGAEKDTTGFVKGKLCELLSARVGKWTILTSNLSLKAISENYDARIADRLIRDENILVDVQTQSYAIRKRANNVS